MLEAGAFGVPHPEWGEAVEAAVVLRAGDAPAAADLIAFCRRRLAGFKCPRRVDVLDELPRTGAGKLRKAELRRRFG